MTNNEVNKNNGIVSAWEDALVAFFYITSLMASLREQNYEVFPLQ